MGRSSHLGSQYHLAEQLPDNGAPMKSQTLRMKANELGVTTSYSRPRVSNDNPFAESLFRTCKYRPDWPSAGFKSLDEARTAFFKLVVTIDRFTRPVFLPV